MTCSLKAFSWKRPAAILACVFLVSACAPPRGVLQSVPQDTPAPKQHPIIVATSRLPVEGPPYYSNQRSYRTHFSRFEMSIPPDRQIGTAPFPRTEEGDPDRHFMMAEHERLDGVQGYQKAIRDQMRASGTSGRQGAIIVHGFNTNFAEATIKSAQFTYDLGQPSVKILYSWPSEAKVRGYLADRESVLFARDSLADTLGATSRSSLSSYIVAGHSMGTMLVMEAMRSLALKQDYETLRKIDALVLISADLDIDVFRKQAQTVLATGVPIFVIVSGDDQALKLSGILRGGKKRVGSVRSPEALGNIDVAIVDLSQISEGDRFSHSKVTDSEVFLTYINGLHQQGVNVFQEHGQPGLFQSGVLFVQSGTNLSISN